MPPPKQEGYEAVAHSEYSDTFEDDDANLVQRLNHGYKHQRQRFVPLLFLGVLLGAALAAGGILTFQAISKRSARPEHSIQSIISSIPISDVVFHETYDFYHNSSEWESLMPRSGGFIQVQKTDDQQLGGVYNDAIQTEHTDEGEDSTMYCLSVFHQLHCLAGLSETIKALRAGEPEMHNGHGHHIEHCIDYLRQSVMCAGDLTLESVKVRSKDGMMQSGTDAPVAHQCRNWDSILGLVDRFEPHL